MSTEAVKQWLFDRFTNSLNPVPTTSSYPACSGILAGAGFGTSQVTLYKDSPNQTFRADNAAVIALNDPDETENQKSGGAYGLIENVLSFEILVMWIADFKGDLAATPPVPPKYSDAAVANQHFRVLLSAIRRTLRRSIYIQDASGIGAANWPLTDLITAEKSSIVGRQPQLKVYKQPARPAQDKISLYYGAMIECSYKEVFNSVGN